MSIEQRYLDRRKRDVLYNYTRRCFLDGSYKFSRSLNVLEKLIIHLLKNLYNHLAINSIDGITRRNFPTISETLSEKKTTRVS